jgi:hypothetical protein
MDFRPCPFCAHAEPIVVTIAGNQPAYVIACPDAARPGRSSYRARRSRLRLMRGIGASASITNEPLGVAQDYP